MKFGKRIQRRLDQAVLFFNLRGDRDGGYRSGAEREEMGLGHDMAGRRVRLNLAQYIRLNAVKGSGYRQSAAYFRRRWRRTRKPGFSTGGGVL